MARKLLLACLAVLLYMVALNFAGMPAH